MHKLNLIYCVELCSSSKFIPPPNTHSQACGRKGHKCRNRKKQNNFHMPKYATRLVRDNSEEKKSGFRVKMQTMELKTGKSHTTVCLHQ